MNRRTHTKRVLVLGDNALACLAIVRSLGRAGLEVHLVSWRESRVTRSSRYVRRVFRFGDPEREPARFVSSVLNLVSQGGYDLVVPVMDEAMIPLMDVAEELNRHTIFAAPDRLGFETTHNKAETVKRARALGVDIPATTVVSSAEEIDRLALPAPFPLIVKPARGGAVRKVRSPEQLRERLEYMIESGPVLVQEFCPGHGMGIEVLADHGEVVAAFQHIRVHEPPEGGASTYRQSVPLSESLLDVVSTICREIRFTGPAMFEFKRDPRSGRTPLIEINGRFWGSLSLSIHAGVDFPKLLYDLLVKRERVNAFSYRVPCFARNTQRDLFWFLCNLRVPRGDPELLGLPSSSILAEFIHVLKGQECFDVERISDPLPALHNWMDTLRELLGSGARQLRRALARRRARWMAARIRQRATEAVARMMSARSVLFVCSGNINRSAFAECYARARLAESGNVQVASAGFVGRPGRCSSKTSVQCAGSLGIDLTAHHSRTINRDMIAGADVVFVMDAGHVDQVLALDPTCRDRVLPLGALDPSSSDYEVPDPYGTDPQTYVMIYRRIERCVDSWLQLARQEKGHSSRPTENRGYDPMITADNRCPPNVIIAGMARSGTSLTASVFAGKGYQVGEPASAPDLANPKGYFEPKQILDANVSMLRAAGYPHHNTWMYEPVSDEVRDALCEMEFPAELLPIIETANERAPWVWKDARFCYTLPVWLRALDLSRTRFLIVRRRPEGIFHSIHRHNAKKSGPADLVGITKLIEHHIGSAETALGQAGVPFVEIQYEDYFSAPEKVADALSKLVGLSITPADLNVEASLNHDTILDRLRTILVARLDHPWLRPAKNLLRRALTSGRRDDGPVPGSTGSPASQPS